MAGITTTRFIGSVARDLVLIQNIVTGYYVTVANDNEMNEVIETNKVAEIGDKITHSFE
jgi:hypothetical protein